MQYHKTDSSNSQTHIDKARYFHTSHAYHQQMIFNHRHTMTVERTVWGNWCQTI